MIIKKFRKEISVHFLIWCILLISSRVFAQESLIFDENTTSDKVAGAIKLHGSEMVVMQIQLDEKYMNFFINKIKSGEYEWLSVAESLMSVGGASTSEWISEAVSNALDNKPENVLKITARPLNLICNGGDIDMKEGVDINQEILLGEKRIKALLDINNENLVDQKVECIDSLWLFVKKLYDISEASNKDSKK